APDRLVGRTLIDHGTVCTRGLSSSPHQQCLSTAAHRSVDIVQRGGGGTHTVRTEYCDGVDADPLTRRYSMQVHGQLRVDEPPRARVESVGHAVTAIRESEQPLQTGGLLTVDQRQ